jgi:hypothetical protein
MRLSLLWMVNLSRSIRKGLFRFAGGRFVGTILSGLRLWSLLLKANFVLVLCVDSVGGCLMNPGELCGTSQSPRRWAWCHMGKHDHLPKVELTR